MLNNKLKGIGLTILCVSLWGMIPVVSKLGQAGLDYHQFLFWSSLLSFLVIGITAVIKGKHKALVNYSIKEWLIASVLGFLGTYFYYLLLYKGYKQGESFDVLIIQYTWPIFIIILSVLFLKESLSLQKVISVILGCIAVWLVLSKGTLKPLNFANPELLLWVAFGAFCFATFSVFSKKLVLEPVSLTMVYFAVSVLCSLFSMLYFSEFKIPTMASIPALLINGVFVNGFSYLLWVYALRFTDASNLAPITFFTPVISVLYLILFFSEPFLYVYGLAFALIIASGFISNEKQTG